MFQRGFAIVNSRQGFGTTRNMAFFLPQKSVVDSNYSPLKMIKLRALMKNKETAKQLFELLYTKYPITGDLLLDGIVKHCTESDDFLLLQQLQHLSENLNISNPINSETIYKIPHEIFTMVSILSLVFSFLSFRTKAQISMVNKLFLQTFYKKTSHATLILSDLFKTTPCLNDHRIIYTRAIFPSLKLFTNCNKIVIDAAPRGFEKLLDPLLNGGFKKISYINLSKIKVDHIQNKIYNRLIGQKQASLKRVDIHGHWLGKCFRISWRYINLEHLQELSLVHICSADADLIQCVLFRLKKLKLVHLNIDEFLARFNFHGLQNESKMMILEEFHIESVTYTKNTLYWKFFGFIISVVKKLSVINMLHPERIFENVYPNQLEYLKLRPECLSKGFFVKYKAENKYTQFKNLKYLEFKPYGKFGHCITRKLFQMFVYGQQRPQDLLIRSISLNYKSEFILKILHPIVQTTSVQSIFFNDTKKILLIKDDDKEFKINQFIDMINEICTSSKKYLSKDVMIDFGICAVLQIECNIETVLSHSKFLHQVTRLHQLCSTWKFNIKVKFILNKIKLEHNSFVHKFEAATKLSHGLDVLILPDGIDSVVIFKGFE